MKKLIKTTGLFIALALFFSFSTLGSLSATAEELSTSSILEESHEEVFSVVSTLSAPSPENPGSAGAILWIIVIILLSAFALYLVVNGIKIHKEEKAKREKELIKPKLIISTSYTPKKRK